MSKKEIYEKKAEEILLPIVEDLGFELVDTEFAKEAGENYLRGFIDKEGGITIKDCEAVSRKFSDELDRLDFIEEGYIMEISSPGLDRPLKKEKDFERSLGKEIEIKTYSPSKIHNNEKLHVGVLKAYDDNTITILDEEDGKEYIFDKKDIALARLYISF